MKERNLRDQLTLKNWGFRPAFQHACAPGEILARVVEEQKTTFRVIGEEGFLAANLAGKLLRGDVDRLDRPVVGDWVLARAIQGEKKCVIQKVLTRESLLRRKAPETGAVQPLAANVDLTVVVTSLNREFNEKRLHRYLTVAQESGSRAAVVLTKSDLAPESLEQARGLHERYGVPCVSTCALTLDGVAGVSKLWAPGETAVFVGSSGVGKSTLVNALIGNTEQETGAIREEDDRGRHTTTFRRLLQLPSGALVIDTPGLREIQLESEHAEALNLSFAAIEELALRCRFSNCEHDSEPGCAVKAALDSGELSKSDHESYLKLRKEVAFQERKTNKAAASEEKKRWKKLTQAGKEAGERKRR
jgi:ribosome biogenesis GTPase